MKNRCVIIGGAGIEKYETVKTYLRRDDFIISCDCGLRHSEHLGIKPDLIVGDFDSAENPCLPVETIVLPHIKDDTDTAYAVKEGVKRGYKSFLLLGAAGNRLDHTLGNVYLLYNLYLQGLKAVLVDDYSEMEIVGKDKAYISDEYPYFSLVNISGKAAGITIENAAYNLKDYEITPDVQLGLSNEPLPGRTASVNVADGCLLLIKDRA